MAHHTTVWLLKNYSQRILTYYTRILLLDLTYGRIWYGCRPQPRSHCVRWRPSSPLPKGTPQPALFCPCLLWPNGRPSQLLL